jgi:microsomal epoxide hydrolase
MNANVFQEPAGLEPRRLQVADAAQRRLRHHLGHGAATGEAWEACARYGAPWDALSSLVDYWLYDFELEEQALFDLQGFELSLPQHMLGFVQLCSSQRCALPLLLLHGYSGSPAEFQQLLGPLAEPEQHGAAANDAFHVVCPGLPGFGLSSGPASAHETARACATLMHTLGYARYVVHGSDLGANIALELSALDGEHVAGLHVTALPAYPSETLEDLATLSSLEKSQLACATEQRKQLDFLLPESPIQALAFALAQLADSPRCHENAPLKTALLTSLSLAWALGDASARDDLYRTCHLAPAPSSTVPIAVHDFPLAAPSLRRFAERAHRVVEWHEHERGGGMPGLEQPALLLESLRSFFGRLR